jgi:hypothetical protein
MSHSLSYGLRKIRKRHMCEGCGERMNIGDIAVYHTFVDDGIYTFYTHEECEEYMKDTVRPDDWEMHDPGDFSRIEAQNHVKQKHLKFPLQQV